MANDFLQGHKRHALAKLRQKSHCNVSGSRPNALDSTVTAESNFTSKSRHSRVSPVIQRSYEKKMGVTSKVLRLKQSWVSSVLWQASVNKKAVRFVRQNIEEQSEGVGRQPIVSLQAWVAC